MPKIQVDFSQIPSNNIPDGTYEAEITGVELRTSQSSGNPYLNWEFTITEGEYAGRKVWLVTGLSEKALWKLKETFAKLGFDQENVDIEIDDDTNIMIEPNLSGTPVLVEVLNETYEGRTNSRVSQIVELLDVEIES